MTAPWDPWDPIFDCDYNGRNIRLCRDEDYGTYTIQIQVYGDINHYYLDADELKKLADGIVTMASIYGEFPYLGGEVGKKLITLYLSFGEELCDAIYDELARKKEAEEDNDREGDE